MLRRPAKTDSRSSWRGGLSCAPSCWHPLGPPIECPPCPPLPSRPIPELGSMVELTLTQSPAHVRQGSNIGQPHTRREGVLKVTGGARYAADNHPAGMLHAVMAISSIARGRVTG